MTRIALTGGIASGKSMVADAFARCGALIIDADVLAREVVAPHSPGLERIVQRFGRGMLREDGTLDRARLGDLVFVDDDARADLNAIVHPLVRERSQQLFEAAPAGSVVIEVIPLLVETGLDQAFDHVIAVDAPTEVQVRRLMRRSGLTADQARRRVRIQAGRDARIDAAEWVIDNSGDQASTVRQVEELWPTLVDLTADGRDQGGAQS